MQGDKQKPISAPFAQTTYIQNNINVYSQNSLEEIKDMELPDGSIYSGQVLAQTQIRQGFGTQQFPDGARYVGEWINNKVEGSGTFYHTNGDTFEGTFKDEKANGHGVYTHSNGQKYIGNWVDDMQDGDGKEILADGSCYIGKFEKGMKHG